MINRRQFNKLAGLAPLALAAPAPAQKASDQRPVQMTHEEEEALIMDKLFGPTRSRIAPPPTLEHLPKADTRFAVFTDIHIGIPGDRNWRYSSMDDHYADAIISHINAVAPDLAIHTGDATWGMLCSDSLESFVPRAKRAKEFFARIQCPFYNMPGTHDICGHYFTPEPPDPKRNAYYEGFRDKYHKLFGKDYYSVQKDGCYFILMNCALLNTGQKVTDDMMAWLKAELKNSQSARFRFVFTHEPLFWRDPHETPDDSNHHTALEPARSELLDLFSRSGVNVVYSGHVHAGFANQYQNLYLHTLCAAVLTNPLPFFPFGKVPLEFPILPNGIEDPYKFGYLLVRARGNQLHESWIPPVWRVGDAPPELNAMHGGRLVGRPATEMEDSSLGLVATPPTSFIQPNPPQTDVWNITNDLWWRTAEKVGATWQQAWPPAAADEDFANLERALTYGRLRGVRVALPLPAEAANRDKTWALISKHQQAVSGIVVCNGKRDLWPTDTNSQLTTWRTAGAPAAWAKACGEARKKAPAGAKIILARLLLRDFVVGEKQRALKDQLALIGETAAALKGNADILSVWMKTQGPPEPFFAEIRTAARLAAAQGLGLWLDAVGWEYVDEPRRSAYFLRLLALCHAAGVRLFWWNGPHELAGLLDRFYDPTPMFFAAQAWQSVVDPPAQPVDIQSGEVMQLRWRDREGRRYLAWWRASADGSVKVMERPAEVTDRSLVIDPLYARILKVQSGKYVPLCNWPLVARNPA